MCLLQLHNADNGGGSKQERGREIEKEKEDNQTKEREREGKRIGVEGGRKRERLEWQVKNVN